MTPQIALRLHTTVLQPYIYAAERGLTASAGPVVVDGNLLINCTDAAAANSDGIPDKTDSRRSSEWLE